MSLKSFITKVKGFGPGPQLCEVVGKVYSKCTYLLEADISESKYVTWLEPIVGSIPVFSSVLITSLDDTTNRSWYDWFSLKKSQIIGDSWAPQKDRTWAQFFYEKKGAIVGTTLGLVTVGIGFYVLSVHYQRFVFFNEVIRPNLIKLPNPKAPPYPFTTFKEWIPNPESPPYPFTSLEDWRARCRYDMEIDPARRRFLYGPGSLSDLAYDGVWAILNKPTTFLGGVQNVTIEEINYVLLYMYKYYTGGYCISPP